VGQGISSLAQIFFFAYGSYVQYSRQHVTVTWACVGRSMAAIAPKARLEKIPSQAARRIDRVMAYLL
jgi:hypothetical protein